MIERLFVYGTLAPGRPNEHVLAEIEGAWQTATVTGRLRQEGWGAEMGYPALSLDGGSDTVQGFVFSSENLVDHWGELDAFEGEAYQRVLTDVTGEDGTPIRAFVYALRETG